MRPDLLPAPACFQSSFLTPCSLPSEEHGPCPSDSLPRAVPTVNVRGQVGGTESAEGQWCFLGDRRRCMFLRVMAVTPGI